MDPLPQVKRDLIITPPLPWDPSIRPIIQRSLGCHVRGVALPHPDPACPNTMIAGVCKPLLACPQRQTHNGWKSLAALSMIMW
jgi:hypothetical protein